MIVYAESSAVLSWLLAEPLAPRVSAALRTAEQVVASVLTGVECSRAIVRGVGLGHLTKAQARKLGEALADAEDGWHRLELSDEVVARARAPFPVEPVRTLDALHLASILLASEAYGEVLVASFDERVRANARALGVPVIADVA